MKILAIFFALASWSLQAAPSYVNTNGPIVPTEILPTSLTTTGAITYNPSQAMLVNAGWRLVTSVESPAAGMAVDTYRVVEGPQWGRCSLAILTQHNMQESIDAGWTNSPEWNATLVTNAQAFRRIVRAYMGAGAETNTAVTDAKLSSWAVKNSSSLTTSNMLDVILLGRLSADLRELVRDTKSFPWRLIP